MRILVLGAEGQVGRELTCLLPTFCQVIALGRSEVELGDLDALRTAVATAEPQAIVNTAAYNEVDRAEDEEAIAERVNGDAVGLLGEEAAKRRAILIHFSTDFVFDGQSDRPYRETDAPAPLSAYGRSKLAGERQLTEADAPAIVFRTSWVYGLRRRSFVKSILRAARERETLQVVDDQVGCPTAARDLAVAVALVLFGARRDPFGELAPARGIYHLAGGGHTSRFELARAALELDPRRHEHRARSILPVSSRDLVTRAQRPAFAPLDCDKARRTFGVTLEPWKNSLARVLSDLELSP